jgi:hypothetical protein
VVPPSWAVSVIPSKREAHRELRWPLMQISYRLEPCGWPAEVVLTVRLFSSLPGSLSRLAGP